MLDLRWLMPFDKELLLSSAKKTGRVLIVHEDTLTGGGGAEVAALISEHAFQYLDAPIKRVSQGETPMAYAKTLERETMPTVEKIVAAILESLHLI